jgi:hypothetical protein
MQDPWTGGGSRRSRDLDHSFLASCPATNKTAAIAKAFHPRRRDAAVNAFVQITTPTMARAVCGPSGNFGALTSAAPASR